MDAIKNADLVTWKIKNRWVNCTRLASSMEFFIVHNFCEGNTCADTLASHASLIGDFFWWDTCPSSI